MKIEIPCGQVVLIGDLKVPKSASGLVIFVHGSGSSRYSPRNIFVAERLNEAGFATLLFDLLTVDEEFERQKVFDIELLAKRLVEVTKSLISNPEVGNLPIGYFGASTGAAAALVAASILGKKISAIVSRGGRVDLAGDFLAKVQPPTLMIVGEDDYEVLELNYQAHSHMNCEKQIQVIKGATHLFEEPGALEQVANLASAWFKLYH